MDGFLSSLAHTSLISLLLTPCLALASIDSFDEEPMYGYDTIVNELNKEIDNPYGNSIRGRQQAAQAQPHALDSVWMHFGVGFTSMMQQLSLPNNQVHHVNQRGFQASLGIDLLSPNWMAEGITRSFGESSDDQTTKVALKEFELKIHYRNRLSRRLGVRMGGGLSARYMTIRSATTLPIEYTTPSSVATLGFDFFLNDRLSLGADLSARNTMTGETPDANSYDAALRMDTHF